MQFRVYLPPCYAETSDKRYPVLYLLHGQTFTEDQWQRLGAPETADRTDKVFLPLYSGF